MKNKQARTNSTIVQVGGQQVMLPSDMPVQSVDPAEQLLAEATSLKQGQCVLLLGAGSGVLAVVVARNIRDGQVVVVDHLMSALTTAQATAALNDVKATFISTNDLLSLSDHSFDHAFINIAFQPNSTRLVELLRETKRLVRPGGHVYVAGARDRGADSAIKRLGEIFGGARLVAYRKGYRVGLAIQRDEPPSDNLTVPERLVTVELRGSQFVLEEDPGVFARGLLDPAAVLLAEAMEIHSSDRVLDLGCGSGILGMVAAHYATEGHVWLVDANSEAVMLTQRNLLRNHLRNATALGSDSTSAVSDLQFDVVVSNPPFHEGRREARDLGPRFIADAANLLRPAGRCYIVANRFLPYEAVMRVHFADVREIAGNTRFKVLCGVRESIAETAAR